MVLGASASPGRGSSRRLSRSYIYDLPFEETVRRDATKPVATAFGEDEMRQWYRGFEPITALDEVIITEHDSLDTTVARILEDCWPSDS